MADATTRRNFLTGAGAMTASAIALTSAVKAATWEPSLGYPDSHTRTLDPDGRPLRANLSKVAQVATGFNFVEGPCWFGAWGSAIFSDLYSSRQHLWNARTGQVSVFREEANFTDGAAADREGRLVNCEQRTRQITRIEHDGALTVIAARYNGKKLNGPNDVVVKSDGSIWFTDPGDNLHSDGEGVRGEAEQPHPYVFRVDPKTGDIRPVIEDIHPNGLCFSPDESILYVLDTSARIVRAYDVVNGGTRLGKSRPVIQSDTGSTDGFRCDEKGNIWCGWNDSKNDADKGVRVFSPEGKPLLQITLPENASNLCFVEGMTPGVNNRILICAQQSIYTAWTNVRGAKLT